VIVAQEWWGLVDHMVEVCDWLAADGLIALAPDLYGGSTTHDYRIAEQMMQELHPAIAAERLGDAVHYLLARPESVGSTVPCVGFCMGGALAFILAQAAPAEVARVAVFYPTDPPADVHGLRADVIGHWGDDDPYADASSAWALKQRLCDQTEVVTRFYHYPGAGHAFCNKDAPGYSADAAALAWKRTIAFLRG
jgi:carboxymethylenebutenolidase